MEWGASVRVGWGGLSEKQRPGGWGRASHAHAEWEKERSRQRGQDGQEPEGAKERGNLRNCKKPIVCITEGLAKEESGDGSGHQVVQALATQGMESDVTGNH